MGSLLSRLFGRHRQGSGATAKDRLRFVLQHDRINLPPERMEAMKREILAVIVKYLVVDENRVEIDLEQRDRGHSKLTAEIPIAIHKAGSQDRADGADSNGADAAATGDDGEPDVKPEADASATDDSDDDAAKR